MRELKRQLQEERKRINAVLERECSLLPPLVRPVAEHILNSGGKRLPPLLTAFMAKVFDCDHADIYDLGAAVELCHMATLLHDDIFDHAATRRGKTSAHAIFGVTPVMLAGDAMLGQAAHLASRQCNGDIVSCFGQAIVHTAQGEVAEFQSLGRIDLPYEEYLEIISGKTAWALRSACEVAAIRSGAEPEAVQAAARFGMELGIAFQIIDDALDIAPEKIIGKPAGGDIREGKSTPLIRFYWESLPSDRAAAFAAKFKERSFEESEVQAAIEAMRKEKLDVRTRRLAAQHLQNALEALKVLPEGPGRDTLVKVSEFICSRNN